MGRFGIDPVRVQVRVLCLRVQVRVRVLQICTRVVPSCTRVRVRVPSTTSLQF